VSKNFIDLFCGAGGLSLGFERAGFKCVGAIDISKACINTHKLNFPDCVSINTDISKINPREFSKEIGNKKIDLVIGGPPCPTFSTIGHAKIKSIKGKNNLNFTLFDDDRNFLFKNYFSYIEHFKPNFFIMENVPNFITKYQGSIFNQTKAKIEKLGYKILNEDNLVFNAADYGVPQTRKRMIIIGTKIKNFNFKLPKIDFFSDDNLFSKKNKYRTVKDAIEDLPKITDNWRIDECDYSIFKNLNSFQKLMRKKTNGMVKNNICRMTNDRAKKVFKEMKQGSKYMDLPKKIRNILPFREDIFADRLKRLVNSKPSWTVIAHIGMDGYMYIHPTETRTLSVREAARLQSFPDDFIFLGTQMETYHQVGNAVPVLLSEAIARSLVYKI
jgi:DNA (cytosine-5)-methyltransferase 1|tara:strand:- start:125 stop:1282 length:1158 start_codon:yes stop_codon:yes gene_type:complete